MAISLVLIRGQVTRASDWDVVPSYNVIQWAAKLFAAKLSRMMGNGNGYATLARPIGKSGSYEVVRVAPDTADRNRYIWIATFYQSGNTKTADDSLNDLVAEAQNEAFATVPSECGYDRGQELLERAGALKITGTQVYVCYGTVPDTAPYARQIRAQVAYPEATLIEEVATTLESLLPKLDDINQLSGAKLIDRTVQIEQIVERAKQWEEALGVRLDRIREVLSGCDKVKDISSTLREFAF